jgi:hypothetical protein
MILLRNPVCYTTALRAAAEGTNRDSDRNENEAVDNELVAEL